MNDYRVYRHLFPNGKCYVGITSQTLEKRFENGRGYKKCPKMHNAILKYGWNNIEHELLYSGLSKEEAEAKEIELIAFYNSVENGYNTDHGGNTSGTHSIETRKKISVGNKGLKKPPVSEERKALYSELNSGEKNPFYGKHHSDKVKKEHSEFMKGNQYNKGNHHTDEFKRLKSIQMKDKYSNGNNPRCKAVVCTDSNGNQTKYYSLRKAAQELGKNISSLHKAIKKHSLYCGCYWGYENES